MSDQLLLHATITVRGEADDLAQCAARIRSALDLQPIEGEVAEHHGPEALCYDLKVKGGIPFPVFAEVSQSYPGITVLAEWVNVAAGERGAATIVAGKLLRQDGAPLVAQVRAPVCVRVAANGRLELACAVMREGPGQFRGYSVSAVRDAVFLATRDSDGTARLVVTDASPEWAIEWRESPSATASGRRELSPPEPIPAAEYQDLERLAQTFVAEWIWLAESAEKEVAVERVRLQRNGLAEYPANLRSSAFSRVRTSGSERDGVMVYDTLPEDYRWVEQMLSRCWLAEPDPE